MNADWTDVIQWAYILFGAWVGFELLLYAREYWRYWRLQDQELGRIRRER